MLSAAELTDALVAPPIFSIDEAVRIQLRERLSAGIDPLVELLPPGAQVAVTLPLVRRVVVHPESLVLDEAPFTWKPAFVRRSLGLAVVDACVSGRFRSPIEAVGAVASDAMAAWERTGWRTFHWEPWFAGQGKGARAVVLADAVTWATSLWSTFDWSVFRQPPQLGGADDQYVCSSSRTVRLKGRSEMRCRTHGRPGGSTRPDQVAGASTALVSVAGGTPGPDWSDELAYLALVAGLRSPSRPVPTRVMGLWPDAGLALYVDVDGGALFGAADRAVATVAALADARPSDAPLSPSVGRESETTPAGRVSRPPSNPERRRPR